MYTLNISGHQVSVTPEIRTQIKKAMQRLHRYSDRITSINVNFNREKHETSKVVAEATIRIPGKEFFATSEADNTMSTTVDSLAAKLEKQLRKNKTKQMNKTGERFQEFNLQEDMKQAEYEALVDRGAADIASTVVSHNF